MDVIRWSRTGPFINSPWGSKVMEKVDHIGRAREVLDIEIEGLRAVRKQIGRGFSEAVDLIMASPGRLVITGIGKSGLIGQKIAATLNSTGTSSLFMHPVEAMHGDLGLVEARDVVLGISNSGETSELNLLMPTLKNRGVRIIAMTANPASTLASFADAVIEVRVEREACPLGLAPTASTTAALAVGDALAVVLLESKKFKESDFLRNHPGGSLGARLKVRVDEVMIRGDQIPRVGPDVAMREAITILDRHNVGAVLVVDGDRLRGIITDGDVRRLVSGGADLDRLTAGAAMTSGPKFIKYDLLAADALSLMQRHEITILPVEGEAGDLVGILHLQDLLGKGEFRFLL